MGHAESEHASAPGALTPGQLADIEAHNAALSALRAKDTGERNTRIPENCEPLTEIPTGLGKQGRKPRIEMLNRIMWRRGRCSGKRYA